MYGNGLILTLILFIFTFQNSLSQGLEDNIDLGRLKYNKINLKNNVDLICNYLGAPSKIDSLKSHKPTYKGFYIFWNYKINKSYLSLRIKNDSSILSSVDFKNGDFNIKYDDITFSRKYLLINLKKDFPDSYDKYIVNNKGKVISMDKNKFRFIKYEVPIYSVNPNGILQFEFNKKGFLQSISFSEDN